MTILDAAVTDKYIAVSTYSGTQFRLHVLRIEYDADHLYVTTVQSYDIDGEVTCVALCLVEDRNAMELQAGMRQQGRPLLGRTRALVDGDLISFDHSLSILDPTSCKCASSDIFAVRAWPSLTHRSLSPV